MEIARIACLGVVCAFACLLLRQTRPELALVLLLAGGTVILAAVVGYLAEILGTVRELVAVTGLDTEIFSAVIKMIGIGYVAEFGAGICEDSGVKSLGDKIVLAGKVLVLALSMPVVAALMRLLVQVL